MGNTAEDTTIDPEEEVANPVPVTWQESLMVRFRRLVAEILRREAAALIDGSADAK